jgi:hypothetical protein
MAKRTIRRRMRKNRTIRKVMRGCNRRRMKKGGAPPGTIQAHTYPGQSPESIKTHAALTEHVAGANNIASNTPGPLVVANRQSNMAGGISTTPANGMQGGARTRHHRRRLRYKKSMARKSRRA